MVPAAAPLADNGVRRRPRVVQEDLAGAGRPHSHQFQTADLDACLVARRQNEGQPTGSFAFDVISPAKYQDRVRIVSERGKELLAADNPLVSVPLGPGRQAQNVRAAAGLCHTECHQEVA